MEPVSINHVCGHTVEHLAWGKRIDWLRSKPCPACIGLKNFTPPKADNHVPAPREIKASTPPPCLPPGFEREFRFAPPRRWRFDFAWPAVRVALEVEGGFWIGGRHGQGKGALNDMEKYNEAISLGWKLFRCTPATIQTTVERYILPCLNKNH